MRPTKIPQVIAALASMPLLVALSGCDASPPEDPEWNLERVEGTWEITAPSGAQIRDYFSSEVDFHGGRDDVFVLEMPHGDRVGVWDPEGYQGGIPRDGAPTAQEITDSAGASFDDGLFDALDCGEPIRADQDYLLICFHEEGDDFYVFEQIF